MWNALSNLGGVVDVQHVSNSNKVGSPFASADPMTSHEALINFYFAHPSSSSVTKLPEMEDEHGFSA